MYYQSILAIGNDTILKQFLMNTSKTLLNTNKYIEHPDYYEIEEKEKNSIGIELIKNLNEILHIRAYQGKNRLIVIKNGEKLTHQAQNAMLKIIEEPPKFTQIIIFSTNDFNILDTIKSRCLINHYKTTKPEKKEKSILNLEIYERFKILKDIYTIKNSNEKKETIHNFLENLYYEIDQIPCNSKKLQLINDSYKKIKANTNIKLVLENLLINI